MLLVYFLSLTDMEKTLWLRLNLAIAEMDMAETENPQLLVGCLANSQILTGRNEVGPR